METIVVKPEDTRLALEVFDAFVESSGDEIYYISQDRRYNIRISMLKGTYLGHQYYTYDRPTIDRQQLIKMIDDSKTP